jgi:hypothetical protein
MFETLYQSETGRVLIQNRTLIAEVVTGSDRVGAKLYAEANPEQTLLLFQAAILQMHEDEVKSRWKE